MARRRVTTTKYEIIQVASEFFLDVGYSNTSPKMIAEELDLSTGNITYYFPSKEHLLAVIVEMLCDFQWKMLEVEADGGVGSVSSICYEMMTVAASCEKNAIARDFFVSTFQSEMCRNYLRKYHVERAKRIFSDTCKDWTEEQFIEAEILVMGIQYATIASTEASVSFDMRLKGALNQILSIYNVDEQTRKKEIDKVLMIDCRRLGDRVILEFAKYVENANSQALEEMLRGNRKKNRHADNDSEEAV